MIPFSAKFDKTSADYDPYIKYKLRSEEVMEYLIQIGLAGLKRVLENQQFTIGDRVQREIDDYNRSNNPILIFLDYYDGEIKGKIAKEIYGAYCLFCEENNYIPLSNIEFSKQIKKVLGLSIKSKTMKGKTYRIFVEE